MNYRTASLAALACLLVLPATRACCAEAGLAEILAASGWTTDRVAALQASGQVAPGEVPDLLRLASRLGRFEQPLRDEAQSSAESEQPSTAFVPVVASVQVLSVERVALPADEATKLGAREYYLCRLTQDGTPLEAIAEQVPQAWLRDGVLPQPADVLALRVLPDTLLVVQWRWLPTEPQYPEVNFGESLLGGLGVDVASLDQVRDGGPLRAADAAPFYAVLSAMSEVGAHQLARFARGNLPRYASRWTEEVEAAAAGQGGSPKRRKLAAEARRVLGEGRYPIAPLFNDAVNQRGELYVLEGIARRAVAIETAAAATDLDRSVSRRFGVDRYYEIEVFTPDSRNLPIVLATLEVPEGFPLGDNIEVPVRVAGFSFKRWGYRTRQLTDEGGDKPQLAPLLIGRAPIMLAEPATGGGSLGLVVGVAFAIALALVCWVVWRTARSDAEFEKAARRRKLEVVSSEWEVKSDNGRMGNDEN